jgi:hypothetical protein
MENLNRWEIANHLHTSVKETSPYDRGLSARGNRTTNSASFVEYFSRSVHTPGSHQRDDRSFTQSLWGRR